MILKTTDEIMGALERGELSRDFGDAFHRVLEACTENGDASGTVTLKLKIGVKSDMVSIKAEIGESPPAKKRRTSNFFVTGEGRLSLQHPDQVEMFGERKRDRPTIDHDSASRS